MEKLKHSGEGIMMGAGFATTGPELLIVGIFLFLFTDFYVCAYVCDFYVLCCA